MEFFYRGIITFLANGTRSNFQIEIAYNQSMSLKSGMIAKKESHFLFLLKLILFLKLRIGERKRSNC